MKKAMGTITTWLNDFTDLLKALIVLGILVGILYNDIFIIREQNYHTRM